MKSFSFSIYFIAAMILISACSNSTKSDSETGSLTLTLTDAPFPIELVSEANVTIDRIEIRRDSTEEENPPFITLTEETQSFNLLDLQNGLKATLVDLDVEAGSYDLVRLYVSEASIVLNDNSTYELNVPSGAQTGIKVFIDPSIEVAGGLTTELLLDFNVAKSFVARGNPNSPSGISGFNFKPTLKAVNASSAGRIEGIASDTSGTLLENVQVALIADADTSFAFTDSLGFYSIISLTADEYSLEASLTNFEDLNIPVVTITAGNLTTQNLELTPSSN